ncbi:hypothetical protein [Vibrio sp.]|uniref:hypothetical protein n=1 Tax=Vibrio sp. TaxID=678 RepID=UPI003F6C3A4C
MLITMGEKDIYRFTFLLTYVKNDYAKLTLLSFESVCARFLSWHSKSYTRSAWAPK